MSFVGVVAATGSIGTGIFALTSDILPYSAWPGQSDRPDGRQLLPPAAQTRTLTETAQVEGAAGLMPLLLRATPALRLQALPVSQPA
ncbi:MAG: hypothetical protein QOF04_2408, partial [Solirubrobacteraceae bacterium]|nr:hypothetical protein [Solirubrobacteraceae bacterium]